MEYTHAIELKKQVTAVARAELRGIFAKELAEAFPSSVRALRLENAGKILLVAFDTTGDDKNGQQGEALAVLSRLGTVRETSAATRKEQVERDARHKRKMEQKEAAMPSAAQMTTFGQSILALRSRIPAKVHRGRADSKVINQLTNSVDLAAKVTSAGLRVKELLTVQNTAEDDEIPTMDEEEMNNGAKEGEADKAKDGAASQQSQ